MYAGVHVLTVVHMCVLACVFRLCICMLPYVFRLFSVYYYQCIEKDVHLCILGLLYICEYWDCCTSVYTRTVVHL